MVTNYFPTVATQWKQSLPTFEDHEGPLGPVRDPVGRVLLKLVEHVHSKVVDEVDIGWQIKNIQAAPEGEPSTPDVLLANIGGFVRGHPVVFTQFSVFQCLR